MTSLTLKMPTFTPKSPKPLLSPKSIPFTTSRRSSITVSKVRQHLKEPALYVSDNSLNSCVDCGKLIPQYGLDCNSGSCTECASAKYIGWKGRGYCIKCLTLISNTAPINPEKEYSNWNAQRYHRKCWIQQQAGK